jgi:hypothetical protein
MARRLRSKTTGKIAAIEFSTIELAEVLSVDPDDLTSWKKTFPPHSSRDGQSYYRIYQADELNLWRQRALILRTNMSEKALLSIEEAGQLSSYALLAADCPEGLTVQGWRSYGLIVLMQSRYGQMLGPDELAARANLVEKGKVSSALASKHIRLLTALGLLVPTDSRWEHQGLPESWQGA